MRPKIWLGGGLNGIGISPGLITRRAQLDELMATLRHVAPFALRRVETHPELKSAMDTIHAAPGDAP